MKKIFLSALCLILVCGFQNAANAQTNIKIAVINSNAFGDETIGLTKYIGANRQIDAEIKPRTAELQTMLARAQTLEKEAEQMQKSYQTNPKGPISLPQIQAKVDEIEKIKREGTYKQEDLNSYVQSRQQLLLAPIIKDIAVALQAFAKQRGYSVIFDLAKDETGFLIAIGDDKLDVTKDFIAFYNTRPAAPAK